MLELFTLSKRKKNSILIITAETFREVGEKESQNHVLRLNQLYVHNAPRHSGGKQKEQLTFYTPLFWCILLNLKEESGDFCNSNHHQD